MYVEEIISVKYDRCNECIGSLLITTYRTEHSEVVHNQVKIGYQLVQYIRT